MISTGITCHLMVQIGVAFCKHWYRWAYVDDMLG